MLMAISTSITKISHTNSTCKFLMGNVLWAFAAYVICLRYQFVYIFRRLKLFFDFSFLENMCMVLIWFKTFLTKSKIITLCAIKMILSWLYCFETSITSPPNVFIFLTNSLSWHLLYFFDFFWNLNFINARILIW